jgi:AraC family transcriptional regulator
MGNQNKGKIEYLVDYIEDMIRRDWESQNPKNKTGVKKYDSQDGTGFINGFNEHTAMVTLASKVNMSVRNLQLFFKANMHETVQSYITRRRLDYAQLLMKYSTKLNMQDLSYRLGFQNKQALNNFIGKHFHRTTPTQKKSELSSKIQKTQDDTPRERIHLPKTIVIYMSYTGNYDDCASELFEKETWGYLKQFAEKNDLLDDNTRYWGIAFDDTNISNSEQCLYYAALSINPNKKFDTKGEEGIRTMILREGDYMVYTYHGAYSGLDAFYDAILQQPDYSLGPDPILEEYCDSATNVKDEDHITKVWIPVY